MERHPHGDPSTDREPLRSLERVPEELSTPAGWLDPYPWYAAMRERAPVRYDDVTTVLSDPARFGSTPEFARELESHSPKSAVDRTPP